MYLIVCVDCTSYHSYSYFAFFRSLLIQSPDFKNHAIICAVLGKKKYAARVRILDLREQGPSFKLLIAGIILNSTKLPKNVTGKSET